MEQKRLTLIVAGVAAVAAFALGFFYLESQSATRESLVPDRGYRVLAAARDLAAGHPIDPDADFIEVMVSAQFEDFVRKVVTPGERETLRGKKLSEPVPAGFPMMWAYTAAVADFDLPPDLRAMTITVSETGSHAGLLVPGDRIDILVSKPVPAPSTPVSQAPASSEGDDPIAAMLSQAMAQAAVQATAERWQAEVTLDNVRVLAVGSRLTGTRRQLSGALDGLGLGSSSTITIAVTLEQARRLVEATAGGRNPTTVLLRSREGRDRAVSRDGS